MYISQTHSIFHRNEKRLKYNFFFRKSIFGDFNVGVYRCYSTTIIIIDILHAALVIVVVSRKFSELKH